MYYYYIAPIPSLEGRSAQKHYYSARRPAEQNAAGMLCHRATAPPLID